MRFAIFSDLHANLEATEAVLADARAQGCEEFLCLGDLVGYNANPHECVELIRGMNIPVVKGNHDEQASLATSSRDFNELAERAIEWTRAQLSTEERQWLADLPLSRQVRDFTLVHATLDSPGAWGYVFNNLDATASFTYQHAALCFFGHTHVAGVFVRGEDGTIQRQKVDHLTIESGKKYFINSGSVGQPRDGDPRAAYCIYDDERRTVEQRRLSYDIALTQQKIIDAGLPRALAERLDLGR